MISVIIPVFNSAKYIGKCLESILMQKNVHVEILIIDDGSTDETSSICDSYKAGADNLIVLKQKNRGPGMARNVGLQNAGGDYVFFIDADDWIASDYLSTLHDFSIQHNCDIVQGGYCYAFRDYGLVAKQTFKNKSNLVLDKTEALKALLKHKIIKNFCWGKLYRKSIIRDIRFPDMRCLEDYYWMERVIDNCNLYGIVNDPFYYYRQHSESITGSKAIKTDEMLAALNERRDFIASNYSHLTPLIDKRIRRMNFEKDNPFLAQLYNIPQRIKGRIFNDYTKIEIHS